MVCWLFVGSWTFASVFSYLGGHDLINEWVLSLDLGTVGFLILAQSHHLLPGLAPGVDGDHHHLRADLPAHAGDLQRRSACFSACWSRSILQTSFLTPPMAMAAYYLKGVAPPHIQLLNIFRGIMPYSGRS